jgi:hypothetical protein
MRIRGIIFSTDAALALITVIVLVAWLPQQLNTAEEKGEAYENLQDQALDRAVMGFYNEGPGDFPDFEDREFVKCVRVYGIDPNNNLGVRDLESKSFCRVA